MGKGEKEMTNFEKIKNMSVEEMAEWLDEILIDNSCYPCKIKDIGKCGYLEKDFDSRCQLCAKNRKLWLESEVEE